LQPKIRDRLFQPFATAQKSNGWGLGLIQARQVVIEQGGDMWVESPSGRGACIGFSLPTSLASCQLKVKHLGAAWHCVQQP